MLESFPGRRERVSGTHGVKARKHVALGDYLPNLSACRLFAARCMVGSGGNTDDSRALRCVSSNDLLIVHETMRLLAACLPA